MIWRSKAAAIAAAAILLGGCATGRRGSLTQRLIRPGVPAADVGGPRVAPAESLSDYMAKMRYLSARPASRLKNLGPTIEGSDRRLAAALLAETMLPTVEAHLRVAAEYRRLGILDSAYEHFNRALQREPHNAEALEGLARIWRDWGLPDLALGDAHRAVFYAPASASALNTFGTILDALGQTSQARRAYTQALLLEPGAAWALNNLCYLDFRIGRFGDARARCEAALAIDPDLTAAHNNLALTLAASGDQAGARRQFLLAGGVAAAEYNLGIVDLANRNYASAARRFADAVRSRPDFTAARERAHQAWMRAVAEEQ